MNEPENKPRWAVKARGLDRVAQIAWALGDPLRVRLLDLLIDSDQPLTVSDLMEAVGESQPLVSHHLRILRKVGLASSHKDGRTVRYTPRDADLDPLREWLR